MVIDEKVVGIIVNYNSSSFMGIVKRSIESMLQLPVTKLHVVDCASYDTSLDLLLNEFEKEVSFIRLNRNLGYAGAIDYYFQEIFNREMPKYVFFANNDFIVEMPETFNKMVEIMKADPRIASVGGIALSGDGKSVNAAGFLLDDAGFLHNRASNFKIVDEEDEYSSYVTFNSGAFMLVNTASLDFLPKKLPFPERGFMYLDDIIFGIQTWLAGFKNTVLNEVLGRHHESLSLPSSKKAILHGRALSILKNIVLPCVNCYHSSFAVFGQLLLATNPNFWRDFMKGVRMGEVEYLRNEVYWKRYQTSIRYIYHLHGVSFVLRRIVDQLTR